MSFTPWASTGTSLLSNMPGWPRVPIISGTFGP